MNTMLFRGFPLVKGNDRLVYIQESYPSKFCCLSYLDFEDWRAQAKSFEGLAFLAGAPITFSDGVGGRTVDTYASTLSANAFGLLGVQPMLGRDFAPADEAPGAPPVAILSYHFWGARFGKRADIVGHIVRINNASATVIGVMPEGFDFPNLQNLWMPLAHTAELYRRGPGGYMAFGRLTDWATVAGARAELETINRRLAAAYPATNRRCAAQGRHSCAVFYGSGRCGGLRFLVGRGVVRVAYCLRQPGEPDAGAHAGTVARTFDAHCVGRGALANGASDRYGELAAGGRGRPARLVDR